jgi:hypothetical protein
MLAILITMQSGGAVQGALPDGAHPRLRSKHWMLPLGKCLRCIAPAAAMADKFVETTQNTNKTQLLASNYDTFQSIVIC